MAGQDFRYPQSATITATVAAVGPNNQPIPTQSILVAGENPSLNLQPLQTDAGGALIVSPLTSSSIVTANQGTAAALGSAWPVKLTDGSLVNTFTANGLKVDASATIQPVSQSGTWNITDISGTISLPTLAATSTKQSDGTQKTQIVDGSGNVIASTSNALNVNIQNTSTAVKLAGKAAINKARNDYTGVNVTTSAYVQLIASTAGAISEIYIFDSSGQTLVLATGGAGAEVDQIYIVPGGNGTVPLTIAASTRVSIKAVSATANAGEIDINFLG